MSGGNEPKALSEFQKLTDKIYLYDPAVSNDTSITNKSDPQQPDLILFCSWMDAQARHIAKYTTHYQRTHPHTPILLVRNTISEMMLAPYWLIQRRTSPAIDIIDTYHRSAAKESRATRILLHAFSNGGSTKAVCIAKAFRARAGAPLPVTAICLDSCPGLPSYQRSVNAMVVGIPRNPLAQILGRLTVHLFLILYIAKSLIPYTGNFFSYIREGLNDQRLFGRSVPRCYLYSEADRMVGWKDVEAHADETEAKGSPVSRAKFVDSPHAGHVRESGEKYWSAVAEAYGKGISASAQA